MHTGAAHERRHDRANWARRLGWLLLLWLAGVAALGAVAFVLRLAMAWVGLSR